MSHRILFITAFTICYVAPAQSQPAEPSPPSVSPSPSPSETPPSTVEGSAPTDVVPSDAVPSETLVDDDVADTWAPEPELVDYVSASTKLTEQARQSPSSVWVVTRDQIALAGYRSVAEALSHVPGLTVSYDLDNYNVALRGLYGGARAGSRYIKVMIDGRAISFAQSGVHYLGPEFIPIVAVERIEVVRGPVSSLYGAGALVGAINIVTRRPSYEGELTTLTVFDAGGSTVGARGGSGQGLQVIVGERSFLLLAIGAGYLDRSGLEVPKDSAFSDKFIDAMTKKPLQSQNDTTRPISALVRGEQFVGGGRFSGIGVLQLHDAANEFHDLAALKHGNRSQLYSSGLGVSFERATASRVTVVTSAGLWAGGTRGGEAYDLDPTATFSLTRQLSYQLVEGGVEVRYDNEGGGWLQLGVDGQYDNEQLPLIIEINRTTKMERERLGSGASATLANGAVYGQVLLPLHESVRVAATARWDQHNIYGGAFSARGAITATPTPQLALKVMGGRSYKAPSPEQLFGIGLNQLDVTGKPSILPQYVNGIESLIDYFLARQVNVNVGAYYQRYVDTLSFINEGGTLVAKAFDADSFGVEAALRMSVPAGSMRIEASVGGALQQLIIDAPVVGGASERRVPDNEGVPTALVNGRVALFGPKGSGGQILVRYASDRTPSQSNLLIECGELVPTDPCYRLRAFTTVDASLASPSFSLSPDAATEVTLKLRAGISNAFDKRYAEIGFNGVDIPALGRTVWFGGTATF